MPIRVGVLADLNEICALIRELAAYEKLDEEVVFDRDTLATHLFGAAPCARVLMATTDDGTVAGMALWYPTFSTFGGVSGIWLEDLFIRPEYRRRGYGTALIGRLRQLTTGRVEWAVLDWNATAIDFYERLGARPVEGWTRYRWTPDDGTGAADLR